ncbi:MAG: COX15/CtaA family protein [Betaproteobacteria bacterium]|nr:MAG: heme A synthase [Betaproteobacteria bacterium SG8_41]UCF77014.1 MAG: COX15/CtaA family protein [Betaproteobacteria bacterium]
MASTHHRAVAVWLLTCCALIFAMVVLGGVTRLTHSGLSIVEWQPLVGTVPPLNDQDWQALFEKYRQTPEYRQVNKGMSVDEFKGIFWLEYFHRLLGRLIGVVFFVPLLYFWLRRRLDRPLGVQLGGIFLLGALQGGLGWYMVASGLIDEPRVSQFRLTAHLSLAFLIYAAILWVALDLLWPRDRAGDATGPLRRMAWAITAVVAAMVITGGFVAGIRAGKAYNTFPLMNGHLVPPEIFMLDPWYSNFFYNMATVQFDHRLFAWVLAVLVTLFWLKIMRSNAGARVRMLAHVLLAALVVQVTLGISTLLLAVPVALGAAHQGGALVVLTVAIALNHALRRHESIP